MGIRWEKMPKKAKADLVHQESLQVIPKYRFLSLGAYEKVHKVHFFLYGILKRVLDLVFALALIVLLSPLLIVVAILVKLDSPGPALFKQKRTGKNGKEFYMLKFRSMAADNDVKDASCGNHYTRLGKFLRRTSIDELPQLFNIVLGQMSFIGPRPWIVEYWTNMNEVERGRAKVLPGITGLAAVKGRNGLSIFEKIGYDLTYVQNYSLIQDIKIVFMTILVVLKGEEADAGKEGIFGDLGELKARK